MPVFNDPRFQTIAQANLAALEQNPYPGRFIVAGRTADGSLFLAYAIMGRSTNSRNRMFVAEGSHVRTEAVDPAKLEDPSLIIYHPLRTEDSVQILTNGDQTDTIWTEYKHRKLLANPATLGDAATRRDLLAAAFAAACFTRTYEPDPPHLTPRISCVADAADPRGSYAFSILKSCHQADGLNQRNFYHYETGVAGYGHAIHTYLGDGTPLPTFAGEPVLVPVQDSVEEAAEFWWSRLHAENRISLLVKLVEPSGEVHQKIINRYA